MFNRDLANSKRTAQLPRRPAFTLVELMVVLVIIAILGSVIMFAMFNAQSAAREAKTKNMISKLSALIMRRYESYMTRRVPIREVQGQNPNITAYYRLHALRELMRLEMPDRWTDVMDKPFMPDIYRPAVSKTYLRKVTAARVGDGDGFQGAECLYMIVAFGLEDPDALSHFSQSDIGDTDNDGLLEFLDGWGRPIGFIRWPAGFESPRQARDETKAFDQFNPRRVNDLPQDVPQDRQPPQNAPRRYALFPLIYSGGADLKADLANGLEDLSQTPPRAIPIHFSWNRPEYVDPYLYLLEPQTQQRFQIGQPADFDGDGLDHGDNIHNHNLTVR
jgi:prepilin-type N-terminal cleavage/methylation domain-containing protein